ncbi:hypothetical protein EGR_01633 [Echinococcus granulosus]|uniref:Uncharacterized protein n=1 Tax=Echinococcus granulosus TaxID=6210 RepID=W6USD2_ECHGR|nr:hypothetical protein EGR_01633 [Echinococcus granulosus]EUB63551.1 hypothetical protein EGR_01633 [Echinococcus granulosus]
MQIITFLNKGYFGCDISTHLRSFLFYYAYNLPEILSSRSVTFYAAETYVDILYKLLHQITHAYRKTHITTYFYFIQGSLLCKHALRCRSIILVCKCTPITCNIGTSVEIPGSSLFSNCSYVIRGSVSNAVFQNIKKNHNLVLRSNHPDLTYAVFVSRFYQIHHFIKQLPLYSADFIIQMWTIPRHLQHFVKYFQFPFYERMKMMAIYRHIHIYWPCFVPKPPTSCYFEYNF